jgi:[acyl-carrier-protein] S-malonyltransferase
MAANATGGLVTTADEIHQALILQIASPVRWVECVQALDGAGCTTYLELGSGRVLSGLVRQVLGMETEVATADSPAKIENFVAAQSAQVQ